MRWFVGGYTADSGGKASGIGVLTSREGASSALKYEELPLRINSPSWITADVQRESLYVACESEGAVRALRVRENDKGLHLAANGDGYLAGAALCHTALAGDRVYTSSWGDGDIGHFRVTEAGVLDPIKTTKPADDPYAQQAEELPEDLDFSTAVDLSGALASLGIDEAKPSAPPRIEAPAPVRPSRAHQVLPLPNGDILAMDMGRDIVRVFRRGTEQRPVVLPFGTGPRHAVWHPSGHVYVATELSRELYVLGQDRSGAWRVVSGAQLAAGTPATDTAAEISLGRLDAFVYVSVRGSDVMSVLEVRGDGSSVAPRALVDAGVTWPRFHTVVDDVLLTAGERSDEIVSSVLDPRTGIPGPVRHRIEVPSPTVLARW